MRLQTITLNRARRLRKSLSPPDVALWAALKGRQPAALMTVLDEVRHRAPSVAPRQLPRERGSI